LSDAGSPVRVPRGEELLAAVGACPGGPELLRLAETRHKVALVGGATRDLLLDREPRELDVVVAAEAAALAGELASLIPGASTVTVHDRFGTAIVEWDGGRVDIAERRAESYSAPGALPDVRPGSEEEDLRRRDFTVNAIAVVLGGPEGGRVYAVPEALADLAAGRLRVLHDQSFIEDPTRLLRLARYQARLRFEPEPATAALAADALADGALATVTGARVGAELRLALSEPHGAAALAALQTLGVLGALDVRLRFDEDLARRALALLPDDGRRDLLLLSVLLEPLSLDPRALAESTMPALLDRLEFTAAERATVVSSALRAPALVRELEQADRPSRVREAVGSATVEALALAGALAEERESGAALDAARGWLERWRHVRLAIGGDELIAAGIQAGPEIGHRLEAALTLRLDGELDGGREAELRAALEASA
jgi:tRNA nucleotidyltransferase (CCA-adding enzyme)